MDDLAAADTVVSFTSAASGGKGGRHVEFGLVLGLGKHLVVIGPRGRTCSTRCLLSSGTLRGRRSWPACLRSGRRRDRPR